MPGLGARLYGRLDPYTPEKVKLIYDRLARECPGLLDLPYELADGIKLAYCSFSNCTLTRFTEDVVAWQKGWNEISGGFWAEKMLPGRYLFGTEYVAG